MLDAPLRRNVGVEGVLDFPHLGHGVGGVYQFFMRVTACQDDVNLGRAGLQRFYDVVHVNPAPRHRIGHFV